jgi:hypothetical protein
MAQHRFAGGAGDGVHCVPESSVTPEVPSVSVVHVDTGLVTERTSDTVSSDLPADMSEDALDASIDSAGHLRYLATDGTFHVCEATPRRLGDRAPRELCLLPVRPAEGDGADWSALEVCALDPAAALDERQT